MYMYVRNVCLCVCAGEFFESILDDKVDCGAQRFKSMSMWASFDEDDLLAILLF